MSFLEQFSASFLNEIAEGIDTRTEKAEAYEEEQKKLAERNAAIINTRNLRAQEAALIGQKAIQLGARREHVKAVNSSTFYEYPKKRRRSCGGFKSRSPKLSRGLGQQICRQVSRYAPQ